MPSDGQVGAAHGHDDGNGEEPAPVQDDGDVPEDPPVDDVNVPRGHDSELPDEKGASDEEEVAQEEAPVTPVYEATSQPPAPLVDEGQ